MKQPALFELEAAASPCRLEIETAPNDAVSLMRDSTKTKRLVSLAGQLQRAVDPIERARLATEISELAEVVVEVSVREANRTGITWREIGARLGVPFQTLNRRYGGTG